jgi:serine/threonine protein kinase
MPIEQYEGEGKSDERTDVYALGATLYFLLTGEVPTESPVRSLRLLRGEKDIASVRELNSGVSEAVNAAVMKALAVKPEDRHQTVIAFRQALTPAPPHPRPRPQPSPTVPFKVPSWVWVVFRIDEIEETTRQIIVLVWVVVAVVVLNGWVAWQNFQRAQGRSQGAMPYNDYFDIPTNVLKRHQLIRTYMEKYGPENTREMLVDALGKEKAQQALKEYQDVDNAATQAIKQARASTPPLLYGLYTGLSKLSTLGSFIPFIGDTRPMLLRTEALTNPETDKPFPTTAADIAGKVGAGLPDLTTFVLGAVASIAAVGRIIRSHVRFG